MPRNYQVSHEVSIDLLLAVSPPLPGRCVGYPEFVGGKAGIPSLSASEVTLSGLAGGEYFPLPPSKGPAFPFLLALEGYPTSSADFAQKHWLSLANPRIL